MDGPPRPRTGVADLGARSRSPERTLQPGRLGTSQRPSKSPERPGTKTPDGWYGHFVVHVIGAKNLPNVDVLGLSDPFLKLRVKQDGGAPSKYEFKTRIIDDNLNPIWDEYFTVPVQDAAGSTYLFDVTVWDQDPNKVNFLGGVLFPISPESTMLVDGVQSIELKKDNNVRGTVQLQVTYVPSKPQKSLVSPAVFKHEGGSHFQVVCGPILLFRGLVGRNYNMAMLVVAKGFGGHNPDLTMVPRPIGDKLEIKRLYSLDDLHLYTYDFAVVQEDHQYQVKYGFCDKHCAFVVPGAQTSLKWVASSCNDARDEKLNSCGISDIHAMYRILLAEHKEQQYHLHLAGGDQVYCDGLFQEIPGLKGFQPGDLQLKDHPFNEGTMKLVERYYFLQYIKTWSMPVIAEFYANIPSIMTWDDHDIFDGWGSYPDSLQACSVYQGIFKQAYFFYCLFQLGCLPTELPPATLPGKHFGTSQMYVLNGIGIASIDLRTERSINQVLSPETYACLDQWLAANQNLKHLIIVSSIPAVYNDFDTMERVMNVTGGRLLDDIKDHWRAAGHDKERGYFFTKLFDWAHQTKSRVCLISGDVHIGATGCVYHTKYMKESNSGCLNSLITSAIVNVPPPDYVPKTLELNAAFKDKVTSDIVGCLARFLPENEHFYIRARNFLSMICDSEYNIICRWFAEGLTDIPYQVYIRRWAAKEKPDQYLTYSTHHTLPSAYVALKLPNVFSFR